MGKFSVQKLKEEDVNFSVDEARFKLLEKNELEGQEETVSLAVVEGRIAALKERKNRDIVKMDRLIQRQEEIRQEIIKELKSE